MTAVITVYQPHASLIMAGVKPWETRGNPPHGDMRPEGVRGLPGKRVNAGDRILIHAARTWAPGWLRWYDPGHSDVDADLMNVLEEIGVDFGESDGYWYPNPMSLPLGAILGTVEVTDVLPVVNWERDDRLSVRLVEHRGHYPAPDTLTLFATIPGPLGDFEPREATDISDQLPYGNWLPGGWAWELADPIPTTEQCPDGCTRFHGRMPGHVYGSNWDWVPCQTCGGAMTCPPIPVKGKQGVWEWKEGTRG